MPTTLQSQLRPASFRGVPFFVQPERGIEMEGGRRNQVHEYPQRDKPYTQDLGRGTRVIELEAFVVGTDYIQQSKKVLGAMEQGGPGKLIHPWLGDLTVNVQTYRVRYDHGLGHAAFQFSFVEAGELSFPVPSTDKPAASRQAATDLQTTATDWFGSVVKFTGYVNRVAVFALNTYNKVLRFINNPIGAVAGLFGIGTNVIGNLSSLAGLFAQPVNLGWSFAGLLNLAPKVSGDPKVSVSDPAARDAVLLPMLRGQVAMATAPELAPPSPSTSVAPSAKQQVANDTAILAHTRMMLLGNAVGMSSLVAGAVYDDVIAARAELLAALDLEMTRAPTDELYRALEDARGAAFADLTAKARDSARLLTVNVPGFTPAIVLAYDRYEDAGRDAEIIARNRIRHPGFVRGDVLVLSR